MAYDQNRYQSLIQRAAFNAEFFRGTIQDLSSAQRAMSFVGAPTFGRVNGHPCLKQNAAGDGVTSGNVANIVDVTSPFFLEAIFGVFPGDLPCYIIQQGVATFGGFIWYWSASGRLYQLEIYDAAAGAARTLSTPVDSQPARTLRHALFAVSPLSALTWINGIPVTPLVTNTRVPTNCAPRPLRVLATLGGGCQAMIARVWQGTPTNEQVNDLYQAARELTSGEV